MSMLQPATLLNRAPPSEAASPRAIFPAARIAEQAPEPFDKEVTMCDQLAAYLRKFVVEEAAAAQEEQRDLSGALEGFKPLQVRALLVRVAAPDDSPHPVASAARAPACLPACLLMPFDLPWLADAPRAQSHSIQLFTTRSHQCAPAFLPAEEGH